MNRDDSGSAEEQVLEVEGMGGLFKGRISGKAILSAENMILLILIMQCAQVWFMYQHLAESSDSQREAAYILSLSQSDREKLNIAMPPSLRAKMRRGDQ